MKEQVIDAGNRIGLESLITLSSSLVIGSLLASWFLPRRDSREHDVGIRVFEVFAVFTSLAVAFIATYFCIAALRSGEAIDDSVFHAAAALVAVSIVLLALLAAAARFSSLPGGIGMHLPTLATTLFTAFAVGISVFFLPLRSEYVLPISVTIFTVGGALAWLFLRMERRSVRGGQKAMQQRVIELSSNGYQATEVTLLPSLPEPYTGAAPLTFICWSKKGRLYLNNAGARHLRDEVRRRWDGVEEGKTKNPLGQQLILMDIDLTYKLPSWPPTFQMTVSTYEKGKEGAEVRSLEAGSMNLFDVTELEIIRLD
jgi:hypothetical protein